MNPPPPPIKTDAPPLKNEAPPSEKQKSTLKSEASFHEMILRKKPRKIGKHNNNTLKST